MPFGRVLIISSNDRCETSPKRRLRVRFQALRVSRSHSYRSTGPRAVPTRLIGERERDTPAVREAARGRTAGLELRCVTAPVAVASATWQAVTRSGGRRL